MTKDITFRNVKGFQGRMMFNYPVSVSPGGDPETFEFFPIAIQFFCEATGNGSAFRRLENVVTIGNQRASKYTPREIYTLVKNNVGIDIANAIKDLYINAINDDISV